MGPVVVASLDIDGPATTVDDIREVLPTKYSYESSFLSVSSAFRYVLDHDFEFRLKTEREKLANAIEAESPCAGFRLTDVVANAATTTVPHRTLPDVERQPVSGVEQQIDIKHDRRLL